MTATSSPQPDTNRTTDVEEIWQTAICDYEAATGTSLDSLVRARTLEDVLREIKDKESKFEFKRHHGSKIDKFRTLVKKSLQPIEKLSEIAVHAGTGTANSVSADYDKIAEFFEELDRYLKRLKILETYIPPIPELRHTIAGILTSVLVLCGISAKYIRKNRIMKAFRNLVSGEDDELTNAYSHFHKMVDQEGRMLANVTLMSVQQLKEELGQQHKTEMEHLEDREAITSREAILTSLSSLDFDKKQKHVFSQRREGTGQWLLQCQEFDCWFKGVTCQTLWCYGIPGGGKTVLTSMTVNYVSEATEGLNVAIAYIYCDYKDERTHSEFELLSSIARQLANHYVRIPEAVIKFRDKNADKKRNPTSKEWISLIEELSRPFQKTYIFIDALDECPEKNRDEFLCVLKILEESALLFLTSRPIDFPVEFSKIQRVEVTASTSDIEKYLETEIKSRSRLFRFTASDPNLKKDIIKCLIGNAAGMFLLAYLQIDALSKFNNVRQLRKAMSTLPSDLAGYYGEAIKRIESQGEPDAYNVKRAISFIFCARRPLTVDELCHALAVEEGDSELYDDALPAQEILVGASAGLIRVDRKSKIIGLAHHTLQEYLEKYPTALRPVTETDVAKVCLTYLSFDVFGTGPSSDGEALVQRLQTYQLLDYVSHYWGYHVRNETPELVRLVLQYVEDDHKLSSSIQVLHVTTHRAKDWFNRFPKRFGPSHIAAYWGLEKILSIVLQTSVDINIPDSCGNTALHIAAGRGKYDCAHTALERGADINAQNQFGETALHCASKNNFRAVIELLLNGGARLLVDNEGWTPLNWFVINGDIELVAKFLGKYLHLDADNSARDGALFLAAEEGQTAILQKLIESGVSIDIKDEWGSTALDFAVSVGHEPTVRMLLHHGANVHLRDAYENTALHWGVTSEKITQLLLENGADVQAKNDSYQTALCWAAQGGTTEVARVLLKNKAPVNWQDKKGSTALHKAAIRGRKDMVELLLQNSADANLSDIDGWTPLHGACVKDHTGTIEVLLDKVDNGTTILESINKQSKKGKACLVKMAEEKAKGSTVLTGLRFAAQEGQVARLRMILEKGADVNGKDAAAYTALELASFQGHENAVQLLLEHGADVNLRGSDECPPLYYAIQQQNEDVVFTLIEHGADVNASVYGMTLSMLAAETGNLLIMQSLITSGADINSKDYSERTALHFAALYGREDIAKLLLENGADLDAIDQRGYTALMLAVENLQHAMLELLLDQGASLEEKSHDGYTASQLAKIMGDQLTIEVLSRFDKMHYPDV
ncbi:uncharacterized protein KD926_008388 [Aspergillus affinis]|uniref:uncharacterized protein n=1 Tax=Aspergillus affinis TaxID=1070780 RepID=UPI0022FF16D3|nr:uncharacterized protein KD926_008388 [Aspergillus affinis]KAI9040298.1 hypothetical protein KD926_008388 [Aspergillus affinis]